MPRAQKEISLFYYSPSCVKEGKQFFTCKCGNERSQDVSKGYANLFDHVKKQHPDYEQEIDDVARGNQAHIQFYDRKTLNIFAWLEWIVMSMLPFTFLESDLTRKNVKLEPISRNTFTKYLLKVGEEVRIRLVASLPSKIGIYFDGWSDHSTHYVAVFACYSAANNSESSYPLLSLSPLLNEESLTAQSHLEFLTAVLEMYGKDLSNVAFLAGDNCATNLKLADLIHVPFIGCVSHRFNLAMQTFLSNSASILQKVEDVMSKLRTIKKAALLRRFTLLCPVLRNVTRWSSTFEMISRYFELKEFLIRMDDPAISDLLPLPAEERDLKSVFSTLEKFESITVALQQPSLDLRDARVLMDDVIEHHQAMAHYLAPDALIVHSVSFESGIVKILSGQEVQLNQDELVICQQFEKVVPIVPVFENKKKLTYAETILQQNKIQRVDVVSRYEDLRYINPTTNLVERLFSVCKLTLTDYRQSLLPINFEHLLYLKANRGFWDVALVSNAIYAAKDDEDIE